MSCENDYWVVIDAQGYGYRLPLTLVPGHWLAPLHPNVRGFVMNPQQVRTDDYGRDAVPLVLEGTLRADTEAELHRLAGEIRAWVRRAAWLQRRTDGAITRLLEGNDIEFTPDGAASRKGKLRVVLVQADRRWLDPHGQEVTG